MDTFKRKLLALALFIEESFECDEAAAKQPKLWAREWVLNKQTAKQNSLVPELRLTYPRAYREPLRMDETMFKEVLDRVGPLIEKQDTNMRQSVKPDTRLELTLRFLATGDCDMNFNIDVLPALLDPERCYDVRILEVRIGNKTRDRLFWR
ncbi:hypothetical protein IscW_ISCW003820 [Ixodes scapularis]|uniref:Uncharacterized protein n=1 Tax=Ixodes scapularis TaxID=6945 RepID=B7PIN6_IXOSC|nr:hypothetical protein IscW_ISCW003820 [Ixodes scapularis]|eukprot:XP_002405581.1 hypothetical protein IscW_ISCW003820 [Ixodes scapularis]